jgi:hypothetical protein
MRASIVRGRSEASSRSYLAHGLGLEEARAAILEAMV